MKFLNFFRKKQKMTKEFHLTLIDLIIIKYCKKQHHAKTQTIINKLQQNMRTM
jgi:hypothetical protein